MCDNVRAIILCAGSGTRVARITGGKPKSFLPIGQETLIQRQVRALELAGVEDIMLVVGYKDHLFRESFPNLNFVVNRDYRTTNTAHSLMLALSAVEEKTTLVLNADVYFSGRLIRAMLEHPAATVAALDRKRNGEEEIKVYVEGEQITAIGKYLNEDLSSGEAFGVYKLSPAFCRYLKRELSLQNNPRVFYERAMDQLLKGGHRMQFQDVGEDLAMEIDTPDDYYELLEQLGLN